ncbi:hypothetical protein [Actinocatenispora comari]|jgi:hypothetical protein|uniref:Uncharacterized protein n=1 Tax=Actinocatenispora comari TaxID=2807577 RepID=A0A8J4ENG5_9ACTN|nr:hypothetical protein [Actinocatenispora comari]GIL27669.1 hypothetical protein NUM_29230 [Actinocatenispora comari]
MTRVRIETAGHIVEIEAKDAGHAELAPVALALWRETRFGRGDAGTSSGQFDTGDDRYGEEHVGILGFHARPRQ